MYWRKKTRVPLVADNMTRDRYFKLRHRLQLINELDVSAEDKKEDLLWRIRPLVTFVLEGWQKLPRTQFVRVDEQMIPFRGQTQLKQHVPHKPNPEGMKNFVLATTRWINARFQNLSRNEIKSIPRELWNCRIYSAATYGYTAPRNEALF